LQNHEELKISFKKNNEIEPGTEQRIKIISTNPKGINFLEVMDQLIEEVEI
jgi:hypothetical protein